MATQIFLKSHPTKWSILINKFWYIQLLMIGFLLNSISSCKEDEVAIEEPVGDIIFNPNLIYGQMTDQDGNTYKTITIGSQTWMAENLRTTKYRNGDPIPNITDNAAWTAATTGAYSNYKNSTNKNTNNIYGGLYNWFAVSDNRNIAPQGWHVPTDSELTDLTTFLGGENLAGGKMKEIGTVHWTAPNTNATNESGFTALPCGSRGGDGDGSFNFLGDYGFYWSSTQYDASTAWCHSLDFNNAQFQHSYGWNKHAGASVRLIKD
jgi:uncharacterized protein (TIGR02145 family)